MFHAKGLVFTGAREHWSRVVPGGLAAIDAELDPTLRAWVGQTFLASGWYDALQLPRLYEAAARVANVSTRQLIVETARYVAQRDVNGVYRLLMRAGTPDGVAAKLPRVASQYFDFVKTDGQLIGPRTFEGHLAGVPVALVPWLGADLDGFAQQALEIAGAVRPRLRATTEGDGATRTIRFVLTWDEKAHVPA